MRLDATRPEDIARAAEILRSGGLVAFPTETVYGLGANALSAEAVEKIFVAKQRPHWDPLIVHISDREMLVQVIVGGGGPGLPQTATRLIEKFWPGPLTLLLPRTEAIPHAVTAGRPLVGVRMPAHPVALKLIRQAGVPIAAPSANTFGHTSPTTAAHVLADLDGRIDAVLDGGPTSIGLESTVIGFEERSRFANVLIYRPGAVTHEMLSDVPGVWAYELGAPGLAPETWDGVTSPPEAGRKSLPSPGFDLRHYAPRARLILVDGLRDEERYRRRKPLEMLGESLVEAIDRAYDGHETIGVMLPDEWNASCAQIVYNWGPWHDDEALARRLFAGLRSLDDRGATIIICPVPTVGGMGDAIRDRIQKAARSSD